MRPTVVITDPDPEQYLKLNPTGDDCSQLTEEDLMSIIEEVDGDGSGTLDFDGM